MRITRGGVPWKVGKSEAQPQLFIGISLSERLLETFSLGVCECPPFFPELGVGREIEIDATGHTKSQFRMSFPRLLTSNLLQVAADALHPLSPTLHMVRKRQKRFLRAVAPVMGHDKVLDAVVGISGPGDEMIDLGFARDAGVAVEASIILKLPESG